MLLQNSQGMGGLDIALQEMISHATSRVNQYTDECNKYVENLATINCHLQSLTIFIKIYRVQNRMRITELKHEMANMHVTKLQSQLKASIKVSR